MELTGATEPTDIEIGLQFLKPFKSTSVTRFILRPSENGTTVTWSMTGAKTLTTRVMGVFMSMDKLVGHDFEKGLARLATLAGS